MGKILILGTSATAMVSAMLARGDLENAVEPIEDTSPLPGGDLVILDTLGNRTETCRLSVNASLPTGYEIVLVNNDWKLKRQDAVVDYYDGMWI